MPISNQVQVLKFRLSQSWHNINELLLLSMLPSFKTRKIFQNQSKSVFAQTNGAVAIGLGHCLILKSKRPIAVATTSSGTEVATWQSREQILVYYLNMRPKIPCVPLCAFSLPQIAQKIILVFPHWFFHISVWKMSTRITWYLLTGEIWKFSTEIHYLFIRLEGRTAKNG